MKTKEKLQLIEDTWRHYIWEYNFFRKKLNFNNELDTNYVGVIFGYFHDTLPILENIKLDKKNSLENHFLNSIGILQLIYVQQDLIYELNKSFGLTHKINFGKNRELRNELIGHPISRNKDKSLKSFCLFGYHPTEKGDITYLKYHKDNDFNCEINGYFTDVIIEEHIKFLNVNFDLILDNIKILFSEFKCNLTKILEDYGTIDFKILVNKVNEDFNNFLVSDKVFHFERILKCSDFAETHNRYRYNIDLFLINLKSSLIENINNINHKYLNKKKIIIENNFIDLPSNYTFGKLYDNHPIFGINYFMERFSENKEIIEELENMDNNIGNEFEYYCSYNYLRHLINLNYPHFFNE
jgi:hypothetical protein